MAQPETAIDLARKAEVQSVIDRGDAHPSQVKASGGHITYLFLGGPWDGVPIRLYPPFEPRLTLNGHTYFLGPPKDGRSPKLTYRLEGATTP